MPGPCSGCWPPSGAGRPWVVANDEQGPAGLGVPPDPGFGGWTGLDAQGRPSHTLHDVRKYTLWGNLMAGGAGVEYDFGYAPPHSDLDPRRLPEP